MRLFSDLEINFVQHFAPLHYLVFIARAESLKSKKALTFDGFADSHFRSKSKQHDVARGFGEYAFLTLSKSPRFVIAKLAGGFPHIAINVPVHAFQDVSFDLCRYNVAMARRKPTSPQGGFSESSTNGRYYDGKALPIARNTSDKESLLGKHYPLGTMIEVLVHRQILLPKNTEITCYSLDDLRIAQRILGALGSPWQAHFGVPPGVYNRNPRHVHAVEEFVELAIDDPSWRGDGLEFDRV